MVDWSMAPKPDLDSARATDEPGVCIHAKGSELNAKQPGLVLLESIDEALVDLLGRRAREAIYDHLERRCYMARDEIPNKLGQFCSVLETNFGKAGITIERTIAKRFYSKLEKTFIDYPGCSLVDYVRRATELNYDSINIPITTTTVRAYVVPDSD